MKLVYLNAGDGTVIEAQVFTLLDYYHKDHKIETVILLQGYKTDRERYFLKSKLKNFDFPVIWFRAWPNYTWFDIFNIQSLKLAFRKFKKENDIIIHVRGDKFGALVKMALSKSNANFIVDIRAAILEETIIYNKSYANLKKNKIKTAQKSYNILKSNTVISVVSESLKEYLVNLQGFNSNNIFIHPNIAGKQFLFNQEKRRIIREKLNLSPEQIVAVCSNSSLPWQKDSDTIEKLLVLNVKVINLSTEKVELPGVINFKIPFAEVPDYLSAADIAILWRDRNIINKVASPSKLSEFISNGLWIIHNGSVDIACEYINKTHLGTIIQDLNTLNNDEILKVRNINRTDASEIGQSFFGVHNIAESYFRLYKNILES